MSERGIEMPDYFTPKTAVSEGIRMVGKWGRGPSYEVTGHDSLVFLSLGSEVAIVNVADPDNPEILAEVQASGLAVQSAVRDSFLYIGVSTGAAGLEVWNIGNPAEPIFRGRVPTRLTDFCIRDSFAFVTNRSSSPSNDTFKVYNLADPDNLRLVGACRDSGQAVAVSGNTVLLGDWYGLFTLDVSNPANPRRVGVYPGFALGLAVRGNTCCAAMYWATDDDHFRFEVLDISDPAQVRRLGHLDDVGGYDIHLDRSLAYVSGFQSGGFEFSIVSIADSTQPTLLGRCATPGFNNGVWADSARSLAYVADNWEGLKVINTDNLGQPVIDTSLLGAFMALDISITGTLACIAQDVAGLRILDISDPASPKTLSALDTAGQREKTYTVVARDSFAYMPWTPDPTRLRTVDISDPRNPTVVAAVSGSIGDPQASALKDTFLFTAGRYRFQVVNVARPRQPVLVGSCVTQDGVYFGLEVQDSFAYLMSGRLQIINIARPGTPAIVSSTSLGGASGIAVRDTFAYIPNGWDSVRVYSVADPVAPRLLSSAPCGVWPWDAAIGESTLFVATSDGWGVDVYNISNPGQPVRTGRASAPTDIRRLCYHDGYLYAAMWDAGVAIYETTTTGISELPREAKPTDGLTAMPNPTRGVLKVRNMTVTKYPSVLLARDVAGRLVCERRLESGEGTATLDITSQAAGVYIVEHRTPVRVLRSKIVKR